MKNRFIYIVLFSFLIFSCDDYLDVEPKGKVIPSTIEDYNLLLNFSPVTSDMSMMAFSSDDYQVYIDYIGDINDPDNTFVKKYTWAKNLYLTEEQSDLWNTPYGNIYTCNFVINNVNDAKGGEDEEKLRLKAEARVLRAYEYYLLINSFAPQYDPASAATDPGVFIVTKAEVNGAPGDKRESIQEVYDFIIEDLSESIANLPSEGVTNFRPTKAAAYAMLARVYLQMGAFESAKTNADLALNQSSSKSLADYTDPAFSDQAYNAEQYMIKTYYMSGQFWYGYLSDEMASLFDYDHDARIGTIWEQQWEYSETIGDWIIGNDLNTAYLVTINHCVSVPEMYLIRAECNARLASGTIGDVISDLNTLGEKRFYDYTPLTMADIGSKDLALSMVLEERRRELALSANRWFDLKRLNKEPSHAKTIEHVLDGVTYTLAPNANNYIFPIPEKVLTFYPDLEVYPRD